MSKSIRRLSGIVLATASLAMGAHAQAQSGNSTMPNEMNASGSSWYAPAGGRYIGLNAGRSDFPGSGKGDAYSLYMGGMMNQNLGLEFGATDFGNSGGRDAYGFSLSAVGRIPLTPAFSLFGKLGGSTAALKTTRATRTTAGAKPTARAWTSTSRKTSPPCCSTTARG